MENVQEVARGNTKNTTKDTTDFYVEVKDGYGNPVRQLNFDNPKVCPRQGLIELVPLKEKKGFDNRVTFRRITDRETKASIGIPDRIDNNSKEFIYRLITLIGRRIYDLSNENDAKEWACIKHSPYLEGSPNQDRNSAPVYKVYDKEKIAADNLQKTRFKRKAEQIADQLEGEDLNNMLRACGIGFAGMSEVMKLNAITQYAESEPEIFLKHYESPTRKESFLLKEAVDFDIVQNDMNTGFIYRSIHLGLNESEAIRYLKEHSNVSTAINTLVLQKKDESLRSNKVVDFKGSNKDADLQVKEERIRELEAALEKQTNKTLEVQEGISLEGKSQNPQSDTLKARAKDLKIKGWHLMKDDKLEEAIQKAEAKK